jgi:uncharacterized membrane protein YgcG
VATPSLANTFVNKTGYSQTLGAVGGRVPYTWSETGSFPSGLTLNNVTGVISGTPTTAGTYNFTIQVTDADARTASHDFTIIVADTSSAIVESDNGTVPQDKVVIIPVNQLPTPPTNFNPTKAVSFEVDDVTNTSANITLTFSSLPSTPVFYKVMANNQYPSQPLQDCSGASDTNCIVSLDMVNKQLIVRIQDNGIFDADPTTGTIKDPIVVGFSSTGTGTGGGGGGGGTLSGGGGGGCSIGGRQNVPTAFADTAMMLTPLFVIMVLRGLRRRKK